MVSTDRVMPGPNAKALIDRDSAVISPSYTRGYPLVMERGEGSIVWDVDGNRFIDFTDDGNGTHLSDYYYTFSTTYDPTSYDDGKVPMYSDEYASLGYMESVKTISRGNTYTIGPELTLACIFRQ